MTTSKANESILLIYHHPDHDDASTIMEHVNAFSSYSRFMVLSVNTASGFPPALRQLSFPVVILHYSLFGSAPFLLSQKFWCYLKHQNAYKICFFQDEYHFWPERIRLIEELQIDHVFSLINPCFHDETYRCLTHVENVDFCLPSYVCDRLIRIGEQLNTEDLCRRIDIGYRGRQSPFYMGKGAYEKDFIGKEVKRRTKNSDLVVDVETAESHRIYGEGWYQFLADCRAVLGVEAGVSIFDTKGFVRGEYFKFTQKNPGLTFAETQAQFLRRYEDMGIPYRTISPRVFEAAAMRTCQILFTGEYSGVIEPMRHYIPLEKDFSNWDWVMETFCDPTVRANLVENAYSNLIASEKYSYRIFIQRFDQMLIDKGVFSGSSGGTCTLDSVSLDRIKKQQRHHFAVQWMLFFKRKAVLIARTILVKLRLFELIRNILLRVGRRQSVLSVPGGKWTQAKTGTMKYPSYGNTAVPFSLRRKIARRLRKLPRAYASVKAHAKICARLADCFAVEVSKKQSVNKQLIVWGHYLRAAFRHQYKSESAFVESVKTDTDRASEFALKNGASELAEMVRKYRCCYDNKTLSGIKREDILFLLAGTCVLGEPIHPDLFQHRIVSPYTRKRLVLSTTTAERHPLINKEYNNALLPFWEELCQNIDVCKCFNSVDVNASLPTI